MHVQKISRATNVFDIFFHCKIARGMKNIMIFQVFERAFLSHHNSKTVFLQTEETSSIPLLITCAGLANATRPVAISAQAFLSMVWKQKKQRMSLFFQFTTDKWKTRI